MKRHGNLFDKIVDIDNLWLAYNKARRGKSKKSFVIRFGKDPDVRLKQIQNMLTTNTFTTSSYHTKWIYEPKKRLIYVLPFAPDRIVQHAIMNVVEPIWDKLFIDTSYACRVGKGLHAGSRKCMEFVRKYDYCLKCDISKFYPSVNHDILFNIIKHKIKCKRTLSLMENIIYSVNEGKNVPIGNYMSQWFGNLYLNELDQYLKHQWKIKPYVRYCDDFVIFDNNKSYLNKIAFAVKEFCASKLDLILSKCDLFPVSQGVDFLGYRHFKSYILLRKSTARRMLRRVKEIPILLRNNLMSIEQARSSQASIQGWIKWANCFHLKQKLFLPLTMEII
jgi:RNA-directed DNA polymerase